MINPFSVNFFIWCKIGVQLHPFAIQWSQCCTLGDLWRSPMVSRGTLPMALSCPSEVTPFASLSSVVTGQGQLSWREACWPTWSLPYPGHALGRLSLPLLPSSLTPDLSPQQPVPSVHTLPWTLPSGEQELPGSFAGKRSWNCCPPVISVSCISAVLE